MLPSLKELELVREKIKQIRNRRGEFLRKVHYGCFLLCSESGLRISEAVKFNLNAKIRKGLYRIVKIKGKSERLVYVSPAVIEELKKQNWKANQTNRWNFYHFLKRIKRKLNINKNVELTPHTFRRTFATYHAESGMPLPLLQKLLGHSSIRTTALYWRNIYGEDDPSDIFAGKIWLEKPKVPPQLPRENFALSENLEPIIRDKPIIPTKKPIQQDNSPLLTEISEKPPIASYQPQPLISGIPSKPLGNSYKIEISKQSPIITNQREQENQKENVMLAKIKQLEEQLKKLQAENSNLKAVVQSEKQNNQFLKKTITNLTQKNHAYEQNHTNLINAYQKTLNDKVQVEKQVNYYKDQLKSEQEQKAQIEQPSPFKK